MIENNQAVAVWNRCLSFIKDNVNTTAYNTWFEPIVPLKYENKALTIGVPSPFFYEYLEEKYVGLLRAALYKEIGEGTELMYSILTDKTNHITMNIEGTKRSTALPQQPIHNANKAPNPLQAAVPQDLDPHLNPNYNFENFIKGNSNEFSRTVAETVAQNPARTFNPLFLYGPSGVGKTHLINAIGTRIKELYPEKRVLYVSAHLFQVQYTDSVRTNHFNDFERLLTRFKWGLVAELEKPDIELRKNILRNKIKKDGLVIPESVICYIAENVNESVRELEGIVNSLLAQSILFKREIDLELAQRIVKKAVKCAEVKPITVNDIIEKVCSHYKIDTSAIHTKTRKREVVQVRQVAMYLAKKHTDTSSSKIGQLIGNKDHATVLHACKMVKDQVEVDKAFKNEIEEIEAILRTK